jgi:hypothetical protein
MSRARKDGALVFQRLSEIRTTKDGGEPTALRQMLGKAAKSSAALGAPARSRRTAHFEIVCHAPCPSRWGVDDDDEYKRPRMRCHRRPWRRPAVPP